MSLDPSPNFCQNYFQPSPFSSTLPSTNTHTHTHTQTCTEFGGDEFVIIFIEKIEGIRWNFFSFWPPHLLNSPGLLHLRTDPVSQSDWERSLWQWLLKTISPHLSEGWTNQLGETKGTWTFVHCHQWNQIGSWLPHLGWTRRWSTYLFAWNLVLLLGV